MAKAVLIEYRCRHCGVPGQYEGGQYPWLPRSCPACKGSWPASEETPVKIRQPSLFEAEER